MLSDCKQHLAPRSSFALAQDAGTRAALKEIARLAVDELGTKPTPKAPCCMCR